MPLKKSLHVFETLIYCNRNKEVIFIFWKQFLLCKNRIYSSSRKKPHIFGCLRVYQLFGPGFSSMSPQSSKIKIANDDDFPLKPFRPTLLQENKQKIFLVQQTWFLPTLILKLLHSHIGGLITLVTFRFMRLI